MRKFTLLICIGLILIASISYFTLTDVNAQSKSATLETALVGKWVQIQYTDPSESGEVAKIKGELQSLNDKGYVVIRTPKYAGIPVKNVVMITEKD